MEFWPCVLTWTCPKFRGNLWLPSWRSKGNPRKPAAPSLLLPFLAYSSNHEYEGIEDFSETSLNFYRTTRCQIAKDSSLHSHRRGSIKSQIPFLSIYEFLLKLFLSFTRPSLMRRPKDNWKQLEATWRNLTQLDTRGCNRPQENTTGRSRT